MAGEHYVLHKEGAKGKILWKAIFGDLVARQKHNMQKNYPKSDVDTIHHVRRQGKDSSALIEP